LHNLAQGKSLEGLAAGQKLRNFSTNIFKENFFVT
jgi:hypothetical protein